MKIGSIVRLKKKAVKEFYGTDKNAVMFVVTKWPVDINDHEAMLEQMDSDEFVRYVSKIISFEDGNFGGIVTELGYYSVTVQYVNRLTGKMEKGHFKENSLEVVME